MEYKTSLVICLHCLKRWIAVRPRGVTLEQLECPECEMPGAVIETGEEIPESVLMNHAAFSVNADPNSFLC